MTLRETLATMLASHQRGIAQREQDSRIPSGVEYSISHGASMPPVPSVPTCTPKHTGKVDTLKPTKLNDPDIIASYNLHAKKIIRADTEHNEMYWTFAEHRAGQCDDYEDASE